MFDRVQQERKAWLDDMFPGPEPAHHGILGMVEELGEWFAAKTEEDELDAIADIAIFLIGHCTANDMFVPEPMPHVIKSFHGDAVEHVSALARCQLKIEQAREHGVEPRYKDRDFRAEARVAMAKLLHLLAVACGIYDREFEAVVDGTWNRIKERKRGGGDARANTGRAQRVDSGASRSQHGQ